MARSYGSYFREREKGISIINNEDFYNWDWIQLKNHIEEQKKLAHDLLNANQSYDRIFDEKMVTINNMKNLIKEDLELLTKNIQK